MRTAAGCIALVAACLAIAAGPSASERTRWHDGGSAQTAAPTDLDALMERVLARRDDNWKRLQQYILEERETFALAGPGGARLYGFQRDYSWFPRDGVFVRSPLRVNGVSITDSDRRKAEAQWITRERRRDAREKERSRKAEGEAANSGATESATTDDSAAIGAALEPAFVSYAYFLKFRFEPGHYGLVGRETLDGHNVLRIEYYPTELFREGRTRPGRDVRRRDADVEERMNKVSLITLWVEPARHQILQYTFDDIDMDFLPGRAFARVDDVKATMRMGQPFADVWLPRDVEMRFAMSLATGRIDARYRVDYHDYRQADVTYKVR
ncbi:MAG: hypothetical protein IT178_09075 [Acidobacteria bacterium]|nr:hypothetical protein [Acidobacteriota bacterium]